MTRVINGMHLSNGPQWDVEQQLQAGRAAITLLHFQMRDDLLIGQHADAENLGWYIKLRHGWTPQGIPPSDRIIHVRMYQPNWTELDPKEWALHTVDHLSRIEAKDQDGHVHRTDDLWQDPLVMVSPANEQNLHYECGDADAGNQWRYRTVEWYIRIAEWVEAWAAEIDRLVPDRKALLCWPAFAYGHDPISARLVIGDDGSWQRVPVSVWSRYQVPDGEYQIPEVRRAMERFEVLACHPYGHLDWGIEGGTPTLPGGDDQYFHMLRPFRPKGFDGDHDPGGLLAQTDKPVLITESGTFAHNRREFNDRNTRAMADMLNRAAQSGRVLGITWFIWHSDGAHPTNTIWPNQPLREWLAGLRNFVSSVEVPTAHDASPPAPDPGDGRMRVIDRPSSHHSSRSGRRVAYIIVHSTNSPPESTPESTARFFERNRRSVSVHEYVAQSDLVYRMVADDRAAHHVESASAQLPDGIPTVWNNERTWSIEGFHLAGQPLAAGIVDAMAERVAKACARFGLGAERVLGHAEVDPGRRTDPVGIDMTEFRRRVASLLGVDTGVAALVAKMRERQEITPNPSAALQRAAAADGYTVLISDEFGWHWAGTDYVAQGVADITTGRERVYLVPVGHWDDVRHVEA